MPWKYVKYIQHLMPFCSRPVLGNIEKLLLKEPRPKFAIYIKVVPDLTKMFYLPKMVITFSCPFFIQVNYSSHWYNKKAIILLILLHLQTAAGSGKSSSVRPKDRCCCRQITDILERRVRIFVFIGHYNESYVGTKQTMVSC